MYIISSTVLNLRPIYLEYAFYSTNFILRFRIKVQGVGKNLNVQATFYAYSLRCWTHLEYILVSPPWWLYRVLNSYLDTYNIHVMGIYAYAFILFSTRICSVLTNIKTNVKKKVDKMRISFLLVINVSL